MGKFILKALSGPLKGQSFDIKKGLKIGRTEGDIILDDSSVSSLHAKIDIYPNGKMMILDQDSKNRILINNKEVIKSILEKGTKFKIGKTEFEVALVMTAEELISHFMKKLSKKVKDNPVVLKPFSTPLEVSFISGLQKGQRYYLSYGPRFFGSESVDFPLFEKTAPKKSFAIIPEESGPYFVTKEPELVCFNGEQVKKHKIQNGDKVVIGETQLQIFFK